ncbi:hypothetical protein EYF80_009889 [Liparis tanakae]|uniref:Uncharacterized protein n=1 Tax=Liparis tanakae TaxID=230148 RepID=A0A4Z2IRI8_9TELE|nr:hypothetical protein EYF80_009889 [Liparis tanakae]
MVSQGIADDGGDDQRAVGQLVLLTAVQERDALVLLLLGDVEAFEADLQAGKGLVASPASPCTASAQLWKSSFMPLTATRSWGLFGPLT